MQHYQQYATLNRHPTTSVPKGDPDILDPSVHQRLLQMVLFSHQTKTSRETRAQNTIILPLLGFRKTLLHHGPS